LRNAAIPRRNVGSVIPIAPAAVSMPRCHPLLDKALASVRDLLSPRRWEGKALPYAIGSLVHSCILHVQIADVQHMQVI